LKIKNFRRLFAKNYVISKEEHRFVCTIYHLSKNMPKPIQVELAVKEDLACPKYV